jgi:hypothetical protein
MKTLSRFLLTTVVLTTFLVIAQRKQISVARTKLELKAGGVPELLETAIAASVSPDIEKEIARLRSENRDIYKFRGQISQARQKRRELEGLQAQNAQYRKQIEQAKADPTGGAKFPLFNKGQGTPEAALETAFWSMYRGDVQNLARVMPMATTEFERMPAGGKTNAMMLLKAMASTIESMDVLDRESDSPDEVSLTVQMKWREGMNLNSTFGPAKSMFVMRRTNDFWQVIAQRPLE